MVSVTGRAGTTPTAPSRKAAQTRCTRAGLTKGRAASMHQHPARARGQGGQTLAYGILPGFAAVGADPGQAEVVAAAQGAQALFFRRAALGRKNKDQTGRQAAAAHGLAACQ